MLSPYALDMIGMEHTRCINPDYWVIVLHYSPHFRRNKQ